MVVGQGGAGATSCEQCGRRWFNNDSLYLFYQTLIQKIVFAERGLVAAAERLHLAVQAAVQARQQAIRSGSLGLWYSIAGQAGTNGASAANGAGSAVTPHTAGIISGGGSGGVTEPETAASNIFRGIFFKKYTGRIRHFRRYWRRRFPKRFADLARS
jgi:hypothetical protein